MPSASNITVKNAALADIVFSNVQGAAGTSPATYYARTMGTAPAFQPKLAVSSRSLPNQGREVKLTFAVPVTQVVEGVEKVIDTEFYELKKVGPGRVPANVQNDAVVLLANLLDAAQIKDAFKEGYAPN